MNLKYFMIIGLLSSASAFAQPSAQYTCDASKNVATGEQTAMGSSYTVAIEGNTATVSMIGPLWTLTDPGRKGWLTYTATPKMDGVENLSVQFTLMSTLAYSPASLTLISGPAGHLNTSVFMCAQTTLQSAVKSFDFKRAHLLGSVRTVIF